VGLVGGVKRIEIYIQRLLFEVGLLFCAPSYFCDKQGLGVSSSIIEALLDEVLQEYIWLILIAVMLKAMVVLVVHSSIIGNHCFPILVVKGRIISHVWVSIRIGTMQIDQRIVLVQPCVLPHILSFDNLNGELIQDGQVLVLYLTTRWLLSFALDLA
jgi:hypothetical protein